MSGHPHDEVFFQRIRGAVLLVQVCLLLMAGAFVICFYGESKVEVASGAAQPVTLVAHSDSVREALWQPPDSTLIPLTPKGDLIRYGYELIAHTARYLGPQGKVRAISNGMNCQNCHLRAGTKPFGNNYSAVTSTYPKFRSRSGKLETIEKRINDCLERSLNGSPLQEDSREMRAIIAWFEWLGQGIPKGEAPLGAGILSLPLLSRAADPVEGMAVYEKHCRLCHGAQGEGARHPDSLEWRYPPLAGSGSFNTGAGLHRLSRFAGYVKHNMPYGVTFDKPVLTDQEAWDVAAYINSLPRPRKSFPEDWPDIATKPFDHPFGPYADSFSERQHKYGPFLAMQGARKKP